MLNLKNILFFSLLTLLTGRYYSQQKDTIYLMNGHVVVEAVTDTSIGAVTVNDPEKIGAKIHYEFDQLYCVKYANGTTNYYYEQDTLRRNWFTRDEMLLFIKGEQDARKGFKARGALIGSGVAGLVGGLTGTLFGPIAPYGFMALSGLPKVRIRHETVSNPNYIESDAYILGYERVARSKLRIKSLLGGTIGLAVGYGAFFIGLKNIYPEKLSFK